MLARVTLRNFLLAIIFFTALKTQGQPMLPEIIGASDRGVNVLSWISQYDGVKSIAVQRSSDSVFNYITVGYVRNIKKGPQAFIDGHPTPGKNWYRLYIVFNSDLTWTSNRYKIVVDSATLMNARVLPPNDSLQKLAENVRIEVPPPAPPATAASGTNTSATPNTAPATGGTTISPGTTAGPGAPAAPRIVIDIPDDASAEGGFSYVKSQYVFTNPFTGHINLELPDYRDHQYSVDFYNNQDKHVLEISRVTEPQLIIDKRNFHKKGIYKFELKQNRKVMETGYITIY